MGPTRTLAAVCPAGFVLDWKPFFRGTSVMAGLSQRPLLMLLLQLFAWCIYHHLLEIFIMMLCCPDGEDGAVLGWNQAVPVLMRPQGLFRVVVLMLLEQGLAKALRQSWFSCLQGLVWFVRCHLPWKLSVWYRTFAWHEVSAWPMPV